jgi:hypothetical protein
MRMLQTRGTRAGHAALAVVVAGLVALLAPAAASASQLSYDFESGAQGWTFTQIATGTSPPQHYATGGNPDGYIRATDTVAETGCPDPPCDFLFFHAPMLTAGTLAANYGGSWSFDFNPSVAPALPVLLLISDGPGNSVDRGVGFIGTGWHHGSAPLSEGGWEYCSASNVCGAATQAQMKAVLSGAVFVNLRVDVGTGAGAGETYGLDNVVFTDGVPEPVQPAAAATAIAPTAIKPRCKKKKRRRARTAKKCKRKRKR